MPREIAKHDHLDVRAPTGPLPLSFPHPETGELLETQDEFRAALDEVNERMQPLWRVQRAIREAYADRFPAAALPPRRWRTDKQELVSRCPRCGTVPVLEPEAA